MFMVASLALGLVSFYRLRAANRSYPSSVNVIVGAAEILLVVVIGLCGLLLFYVALSPNAWR